MNFLEAHEEIFYRLHKYTNPNGRFEFRELNDGRKVVNADILKSSDFPELLPELQKLPQTTYTENNE